MGMKIKHILILFLAIFTSLYGELKNPDYIKGLEYYRNKKFLLAIGSFKKLVDAGIQDDKLFFYLGNSYAFIENYDKALEMLKFANEVTKDPKFQSLILHNIGYVYYLKKDYKKSIMYHNQAYSINTNLSQVFWYKGMAYFKMKDKLNTINEWERYLELEPEGKESDNIRKALAILKSKDFSFEKDTEKVLGEFSEKQKLDIQPLIDVEGVLEEIKPQDRGKVSDEALEDIEQ
jgi:tetratricopeptide (TPR) repeat protein